jgi:hypothetical protein
MNTRALIAALQAADPSGELEVIAGGAPIYIVAKQPAYYDGALPVLVQDADGAVVGFCYSDRGAKVKLELLDLDDALLDHPELPVDLSELSEARRERYGRMVEETRARMRKINEETEAMFPERSDT